MNLLFDVSPDHVASLNDADLRTLVGLLCEADLSRAGISPRYVSWGGSQDAPDQGIDVWVQSPCPPPQSFIPTARTGFQIKKPDMQPSAIQKEMMPRGELRESIKELIANGGTYIIVSAKSIPARIADLRIKAMEKAVKDEPATGNACVEYYDGSKLASWARQHPSVSIWLRNKTGRPLQGWQPYHDWATNGRYKHPYIFDDRVRLRYTGNSRANQVNNMDGLLTIRSVLSRGSASVRLVGLSGVGKTRFVQALFEEETLKDALSPTLAVYTDVSDAPDPHPIAMAQQLMATNSRAILVVDNCPPDLHGKLTSICIREESKMSLITIEYDVRDDLPEETAVYFLEPSSDNLIEQLVRARYPEIGNSNARRIAECSSGNAKVAIALASTVEAGETLSSLRNDELFLRLFRQRQPDDKDLLKSAEALSIVYSFNAEPEGDDGSEIDFLSAVGNVTPRQLFGHIAELERRNLIQRRGPWRAILPHAIANSLAGRALQAIPNDYLIKQFRDQASSRLRGSFTRRLGYLHDSPVAVSIAKRCLAAGGLIQSQGLSTLRLSVLENIAPAVPAQVLEYLEQQASADNGMVFTSRENPNFNAIVDLLIKLAYDAEHFDRCAGILVRFSLSEHPSENVSSIRPRFSTLFQLYLSGTHATMDQRRAVIDRLVRSGECHLQQLGIFLLDQALTMGPFTGHDSSFGARPRDYGYQPKTMREAYQWYQYFTKYCTSLTRPENPVSRSARKLLGEKFRALWSTGMYDVLNDSAKAINETGQWNEGWLGVKSVIQYDSKDYFSANLRRLNDLEELLRPTTLEDQARALILTDRWDMIDPDPGVSATSDVVERWHKANQRSRELGGLVAKDHRVLKSLLPELLQKDGERLCEFGIGLGDGSTDFRTTWKAINDCAEMTPGDLLKIDMVRGFVNTLARKDYGVYNVIMDDLLENKPFSAVFPWLQHQSLDSRAVKRIYRCLELGVANIDTFKSLAFVTLSDEVGEPDWINLLNKVAHKDSGLRVVVECLYLRSLRDKRSGFPSPELKAFAVNILSGFDFKAVSNVAHVDHELAGLIETFIKEETVGERICRNLKDALNDYRVRHHYPQTIKTLAKTQPIPFMDTFCTENDNMKYDLRDVADFHDSRKSPYALIADEIIYHWYLDNPEQRISAVFRCIPPFQYSPDTKLLSWRPVVLRLLELPIDLSTALESLNISVRLITSGDPINDLRVRIPLVEGLATHRNHEIRKWAERTRADLQQDIKSLEEFEKRKPGWGYESFE